MFERFIVFVGYVYN
jgi:hypothetical protein